MSWAAHDPEGWDEVCLRGIEEKVLVSIDRVLYPEERNGIHLAIEAIRDARQDSNVYEAWVCLSLWAHKEVSAHEGSYIESKYGGE